MKRPAIFWSLQLVMIAGLSWASGYTMPAFDDSNWDTTLFLTPIGILRNSLSENSTLRSFYNDVSTGQISFTLEQAAIVGALYVVAAIAGLMFLRLKRTGDQGGPSTRLANAIGSMGEGR